MKILNKIVVLGVILSCGYLVKDEIEKMYPDCYKDSPWYIKFMAHPIKFVRREND